MKRFEKILTGVAVVGLIGAAACYVAMKRGVR